MSIDLKFGELPEGIRDADFKEFPALRRRSSEVTRAKHFGVLRKKKRSKQVPRSYQKILHEYVALEVWKTILADETKTNGLAGKIVSPSPLAIDAEDRIYMGWMSGTEGETVFDPVNISAISRSDAKGSTPIAELSRAIGWLYGIQINTGWLHRDLALRHLFFREGQGGIAVIDVENSRLARSNAEIDNEHRRLRRNIMVQCWDAGARVEDVFDPYFREGREAVKTRRVETES